MPERMFPSPEGLEERRAAWDYEASLHDRIRELKPTSSAEFVRFEQQLREADAALASLETVTETTSEQ